MKPSDDWKQMKYFQQIEKQRADFTAQVEKEFNLNFLDDKIFATSAEAQKEIKEGKRSNIVWLPLEKKSQVKWSSFDAPS